jgi:DNA-binding XRE family transcriptional regulator
MLVVVKKPRTKKPELRIEGGLIPAWIIDGLKKTYGGAVVVEEDESKIFPIRETDWWKEMEKNRKPGDSLRNYRLNRAYTLAKLAEKLGLTPQRVHDMEKGLRGISKATAKKLAVIFKTNPARFI